MTDRANKNHSTILQALAQAGQSKVAEALGISESTLSRMKDGDLAQLAKLLALCDLKVVPARYECEDPAYIHSLKLFAQKHLEATIAAPKAGDALKWD